MKKLALVFVTALSLAAVGCKKPGADCAKAIDKGMELSKADMQKMPGMDGNMMQKMKDLGVQHCKDDKWSDDAVKCMVEAKTEVDSQACYGRLSATQQQTMNKAAMEMVKPAVGAPGGDMGSATTGSAMGTATAGSAMGAGDSSGGSAGSAAAPK